MSLAVRGIGWLFVTGALLGSAVYGIAVALADHRGEFAEEWSTPAAIVLVTGVIGALLIVLGKGDRHPAFTFPPGWLTALIFLIAVGAGYATTVTDWGVYFTPVFAVLAATALAATVYSIATYWARERRLPRKLIFRPLLWSMIAAPLLAAAIQLGLAASIIAAIAGGLYLTDPSLATGPEIRGIFDELGEASGSDVPDLYSTPTVALALFTLLAVVAPFTEEFIKGLGVLFAFRNRGSFTERDVFVAGVGTGLGFAAVEALGYSLLDVDFWPTMMLLRAPVVIIHVAATLLFARGWYLQKTRNDMSLAWHYGAAVLLHGVWNGLFVATLLLVAAIDDPANPDALASTLILGVVAALGATWLVAVGIVVAGARRAAKSSPNDSYDTHNESWTRSTKLPSTMPTSVHPY